MSLGVGTTADCVEESCVQSALHLCQFLFQVRVVYVVMFIFLNILSLYLI